MISLTEIRERTEKNANLSSDDFGHDCQALLLAESNALQIAAEDVRQLLNEVERLQSEFNQTRIISENKLAEQYRKERDSLSKECKAWKRAFCEAVPNDVYQDAYDAIKIRDEREGKVK